MMIGTAARGGQAGRFVWILSDTACSEGEEAQVELHRRAAGIDATCVSRTDCVLR